MTLLKYFFHVYPSRTIIVLISLLVAGIVEGLSVGALLPLLSSIIPNGQDQNKMIPAPGDDKLSLTNFLNDFGIPDSTEALLILIVTGVLLKSLITFFTKFYAGKTANIATKDLRLKLLRAISKAEWSYFVAQPIGKISTSLFSEAGRASNAYMLSVNLITSIIQISVYSTIALLISWKLAFSAILLGAGMLILLNKLVIINKSIGKKITVIVRSLFTELTDSLRSMKSLKVMNRSDYAYSVLRTYTKKLAREERKSILSTTGLQSAQEPIVTIGVAAGTYVAINNLGMNLSMLLVMLFALLRVVKTFGKAQSQYQSLLKEESGFKAIIESIKHAESYRELLTGKKIVRFNSEIRFQNVYFNHKDSEILSNCNISFPSRGLISIVGPSGTGKTTCVDLVAGLYKASKGEIYIDGIEIGDIDISNWRNQIGYVTQDTILLNTSIKNNIQLGNFSLSDEDIINSLTKSNAYEFIKKLPQGINTIAGEQGNRFSGGQKQRILIARALATNPSLLILDEATSALDENSELEISALVKQLSKNLLVISISHRPALAESSDYLYKLDNGKLILAETD
ncbi:MAG: ABC transporter ATP-binding protein [Gammaproteobacteria bacterium]|nr:ABC transporter ATP-binding protein [Gammaproteobacteria bacterium]